MLPLVSAVINASVTSLLPLYMRFGLIVPLVRLTTRGFTVTLTPRRFGPS